MSASDPEFTKHLTCWGSNQPPPPTSDSISAWLLPHPVTVCTVLHFLPPLIRLISFMYTTHGTKKTKTTQTHMFSCLLILSRRTSPPGKHLSVVKDVVSTQADGRRRSFPPGSRRRSVTARHGLQPCFLAPTSSAPVFLEINQTDRRGRIIKTKKKNKQQKSLHPATKSGIFGYHPCFHQPITDQAASC